MVRIVLDDEERPVQRAYQAKWNPDTGEIYGVGTDAHENGPKEKQGDLLLWGEEQDKQAAWEKAQEA